MTQYALAYESIAAHVVENHPKVTWDAYARLFEICWTHNEGDALDPDLVLEGYLNTVAQEIREHARRLKDEEFVEEHFSPWALGPHCFTCTSYLPY